jgi:hypothetical protein
MKRCTVTRKILLNGTTMKNRIWALALLLACTLNCAPTVAKQTRCTLTKYTSVELQVGRNVVFVPVLLRGTKAWMRLNLGALASVIDSGAAESLHLPVKKLPPRSAEFWIGGIRAQNLVVVESLQIGTVRFSKNTEFLLQPNGTTVYHHDGDPVLGAIGMDAFANVDVELDLAHRKLSLFAQDRCSGSDVYWSDNAAAVPMSRDDYGGLQFPMELDGQRIEAGISTRQWESALHTDVSKRAFHFDERSPGNEVEGGSGAREVYYRAMQLTAPGLTITSARVQLVAPVTGCTLKSTGFNPKTFGYAGCYGAYPLSLGLSVLEKLHLYFATGKGMLYFTAADTPGQDVSAAGQGEAARSESAPEAQEGPRK